MIQKMRTRQMVNPQGINPIDYFIGPCNGPIILALEIDLPVMFSGDLIISYPNGYQPWSETVRPSSVRLANGLYRFDNPAIFPLDTGKMVSAPRLTVWSDRCEIIKTPFAIYTEFETPTTPTCPRCGK